MVQLVVDVEKEIIAVSGELHADAKMELINLGSEQDNLWVQIYIHIKWVINI